MDSFTVTLVIIIEGVIMAWMFIQLCHMSNEIDYLKAQLNKELETRKQIELHFAKIIKQECESKLDIHDDDILFTNHS